MNFKTIWQRFIESKLYLCIKSNRKIFIFFLLVFVAAELFLLWFKLMLNPRDMASEVFIEFEVRNGITAKEVAQNMYEIGLIKHPIIFNIYAKMKGYDTKIKSGTYLLGPSMSTDEILEKLIKGDALQREQKITIPEGYTLEKIAVIFQEHNLLSKDEFLRSAKAANFKNKYKFLESLPEGANLEGFLFPDTYIFSYGKSADYYIDVLLKRFSNVYFGRGYDLMQEKYGFTTLQVITLASIIEAEAKLPEDRPLISSVFHNRLKKNMALQSCATIEYLLKEHKEFLTLKDLEVDSPYNTYKYAGLPPGPIGAPGLSSIEAALKPADSDFLYFVSNGDGSHTFSKTYAEHLKSKRIIDSKSTVTKIESLGK
ncbi:MAG: endolytic transglycosylase MltG [Tepidanaerobacteraceae bacterium]|nr:endolytic transglycosylase MltG [Tepidanaerobacteraceae bacterium]